MQISPTQLQDSKQAGKLWIAIDGNVYDVSYWCKSHPGGKLVLLHSAGRDVSEAFDAYHPQSVRNRLPSYQIGQLACSARHHDNHQTMQQQSASPCQAAPHLQQEDPVSMSHRPLSSESLHPSTSQKQHQASPQLSQPPLQNALSSRQKLKAVQQTLEANGLFQTSAAFYMKLAAWCGVCLVSAVWCVLHQHVVVGALLLGLFWQQVCASIIFALPVHSSKRLHVCFMTVRSAQRVVVTIPHVVMLSEEAGMCFHHLNAQICKLI